MRRFCWLAMAVPLMIAGPAGDERACCINLYHLVYGVVLGSMVQCPWSDLIVACCNASLGEP